MSNVLAVITAWCVAHPLVVMLAWPAFSAAVTWIFRAHSESEYAKLPAWAGHVLRFISALGIDSGSVLAACAKLFGLGKPPAAPPGSGVYRMPADKPKDDEPVPPMASKSWLDPLSRFEQSFGVHIAVGVVIFCLLAFAFPLAAGCKGLTPGNISNIENVVNTVEQDACILATDFASGTSAQTIAEVCGFVQAGTPIAEDVLNHILQILETKKRSQDPAIKAKYAARYAASRPDAGPRWSEEAGVHVWLADGAPALDGGAK